MSATIATGSVTVTTIAAAAVIEIVMVSTRQDGVGHDLTRDV